MAVPATRGRMKSGIIGASPADAGFAWCLRARLSFGVGALPAPRTVASSTTIRLVSFRGSPGGVRVVEWKGAEMETVVEHPAALDVHKEQVTACARTPGTRGGRREQHVAEFKTTVRGLLALRDWLKAHGVTHVAMEASGVYWKPPWAILEDEFECLLVNARHVKQVPGRKTDVSDAAWLCQLLEAGLLRASFVPPKPIRTLRNLTRYRKAQIQERQREANRLHKILE